MAEESPAAQSPSEKSPEDPLRQFQIPTFSGFPVPPNGNMQMFPIMYPAFVPGLIPSQNQEQMNRGAGIYAVPVPPFMGPISGLPPNALIPLTYNLPTRTNSSEGGPVGEEHSQAGQPQQQQPPQRQIVVRRFQIAFQLDVILILKLVAAIFLFNQDGSRQRLVFLVFLASLFYLYQTGAFTPVIRWLSQGIQRAAVPPQPPRPAVRAENVPAAARPGNENVAMAEGGQVGGAADQNQLGEDGNEAIENENMAEGGGGDGDGDGGNNHWWGFVKEIQMIVVGFITSLLPGFHHVD